MTMPLSSGPRSVGLRRRRLSMLTPREEAWTEAQIRDHYTSAGDIVDLGCWLGASTMALARGLAENRRSAGRVIHAYDHFRWEAWMDESVAGTSLAGKYRPGDSFLAEFQRRTREWAKLIQVHAGDLLQLSAGDAAIEFLFVDVITGWPLATQVARRFFPLLLPGVSLVLHQDFVHHYASWLPLLAYRFRDYLEPVKHLAGTSSVIFRCVRAIPATAIAKRYSFDSFSAEEFESAFQWAEEIVEPAQRAEIRLARIMAFIHGGQIMRAGLELMQEKEAGRLRDTWSLRRVQEALLR